MNANLRSKLADAIVQLVALLPERERIGLSHSRLAHWPRAVIAALSAKQGIQPHRIRASPLCNWQIVTDLQDYRGYLLGTYEPDVSHTLLSVIHRGMIVVDAGAHQGYFTLLMARIVGPTGRVIAFEPNKDNLCLVHESVRLNQLTYVSAYAWALSSKRGEAHFCVGDSTSMGHIEVAAVGNSARTVQTITLDEFVEVEAIPVIHFIKMDVEGHEVEALRGMTQVLERWHPSILCEFHSTELLATGKALLDANGYRCVDLGSDTMPHILATWKHLD